MGAATNLLYASWDPKLVGLVCDSSFCNLKELALELAARNYHIPRFIVEGFFGFL